MIQITDLYRSYNGKEILKNIDLEIEQGSFTVIAGANGSGKSTLIKHLNAILAPERGSVVVDGMDTRDRDRLFDIRERVGMVFQNPDSQSVASIVEDDTAFAPENLGLDEAETAKRIEFALDAVGISELRRRPVSTLSGGQKQLAAIAGILAMCPKYMVFDEATSMLDPAARRRILDCVKRLRRELGIAVIWVTHYMDEAAEADRLIVLDKAGIAADGSPREIFADAKLIAQCALELPPCAALGARLGRLTPLPMTAAECAEAIIKLTEARV